MKSEENLKAFPWDVNKVAIAYEKAGKSRKMSKGGVMGPVKTVKKKDGNRPVKIY
ncbi:MAG: hypothetical protein ACO3X1_16020 [Burkholderiaceae bacterium]